MVQVRAGGWARVGEQALPQAWEFAAGVNLGGPQVLVDGSEWISYDEALKSGLKVEVGGKGESAKKTKAAVVEPLGGEVVRRPGLRSMLMSKVSVSNNEKLSIKWTLALEDGLYQVFVWMMEDGGNSVRSLRLSVQGKQKDTELGEKQTLGAWNRFGPYPAEIKDRVLDLLLSADSKFENKEPHLAGIAVYRRAVTGAPPAAKEVKGVGVLEVDPGPLNPGEPGTPLATMPTVRD